MDTLLDLAPSYVPAALAVLALILALWANKTLGHISNGVRQLDTRLQGLEGMQRLIDKYAQELKAAVESKRTAAERARSEPGTASPVVAEKPRIQEPPIEVRRDPLEGEKNAVRGMLSPTLDWLNKWSVAGGINIDAVSEYAGKLRMIDGAVADATQRSQIDALSAEVSQLLPELLRQTITRTDLSFDVKRDNPALQQALKESVKYARMSMIDPAMGEAVNPVLHLTLGPVPGPPDQRGRVGEVVRRGLVGTKGEIIQQAEIREFD